MRTFYHLPPACARAEADLSAAAPPRRHPYASNSAAGERNLQASDLMAPSQSLLIRYRACLVPDALIHHQSTPSARPDNRPRHGKPQTNQPTIVRRLPSASPNFTLDSALSPFVISFGTTSAVICYQRT